MMTTNLFVIANVKQLRTGGSFRNSLHFFRTSWSVGVLNSAIVNSFHNRVEFGTILEGLRNFGEGGLNPPPPRYATFFLAWNLALPSSVVFYMKQSRERSTLFCQRMPQTWAIQPGQQCQKWANITAQKNIFTSVTYQAWYNKEFCQSFCLQSKDTMILPNTSNSINMA